jgi:hypothetical protein
MAVELTVVIMVRDTVQADDIVADLENEYDLIAHEMEEV